MEDAVFAADLSLQIKSLPCQGWLGHEFWGFLSINMDKSFFKAIIYVLYHYKAND